MFSKVELEGYLHPWVAKYNVCKIDHIMKGAISKIVKKLSFDISYGKTGGIFQYFVTFSQQKKHLCIIDIGELIEI